MGLIPADRFRTFAPQATAGTREALEAAATAKGFTGLVLAHWLGQMFVQSKGFTTREESLNYSAQGLLDTFGRHRISKGGRGDVRTHRQGDRGQENDRSSGASERHRQHRLWRRVGPQEPGQHRTRRRLEVPGIW